MTTRDDGRPGLSDERVLQMLAAFPVRQIQATRPLRIGCAACGGDVTDEEPHDDPEDCIDALRARAEKAENERDEERRQRIHEQGIARDAIAIVRRLAEQAIPTLDDCTCPTCGAGGCDVCERREALAAARAWLDERAKV